MINSIRNTTASLGSSLKGLFCLLSLDPSFAGAILPGAKLAQDAGAITQRFGRMRSFAAAVLLVLLYTGVAHSSTIYYVDNKVGSDANDGLTAATAFQTIAKVNTLTPFLQPGDKVLLRAGERFTDDFIHCDSLVKATSTTTLTTNPAVCSGTATAPVTFGRYAAGSDPIIDAADPLTGLIWRSLGNGVYSTQLAVAPQKLYVDKLTETPQLIPVPNFVGTYDSRGTTTYQPWDAVLDPSTGLYQVNGGNTPQTATIGVLGQGGAWGSPFSTGPTSGQTSQIFSPTNSGLQNVAAIGGGSIYFSLFGGTGYPASFPFASTGGGSVAGVACEVKGSIASVAGVPTSITYSANGGCSTIPTITPSAATGVGLKFYGRVDSGSFYYASTSQNGTLANELYVHLADGSDPSKHTFFATHRSYGILLRGVNNVSVTHIQFAHQLKSGVMSFPYASSTLPGMYWTNENINISHATCWNTGDTVSDTLAWGYGATRTANLEACVVLRASADINPHLVRGTSITDSWSGLIDEYYGRGDTVHANFILSGIDGTQTVGGVTTNYPVIQYSYGRSHNGACIRYGQTGLMRDSTYLNNGGIVSNNECTDNANGNIFFGATAGGQVSHNYIHDSLGEGIQAGGNSTSTPDATSYQAQIFDHNIIANLGFSATLTLYNGIDINNGYEGSNYPYISDIHIFNNTIVNTASACMTMEMNVVATHVHENACAQSASYFPAGWVCPNCITTTNNAASIYVRAASMQSSKPMDWHNNVWQNQGGPVNTWTVYNVQNLYSQRGTCSNLTTFLNKNNASAQLEPTSFCTATPGFNNASANDFRLLSSSPLRAAGTGGSDVGALAFGSSMFLVGPR